MACCPLKNYMVFFFGLAIMAGIAPYRVVDGEVILSKPALIFSFLRVLGFGFVVPFGAIYITIRDPSILKPFDRNSFTVILFARSILFTIYLLVTYGNTILNLRKRAGVLNKLVKIQQSYKLFSMDTVVERRWYLVETISFVCLYTVATFRIGAAIYKDDVLSKWFLYLLMLTNFYHMFATYLIENQFIRIIAVLNMHLSKLNQLITDQLMVDDDKLFLKPIKTILVEQREKDSTSQSTSLLHYFQMIHNAKNETIAAFSYQIMFTCLSIFLELIMLLFDIIFSGSYRTIQQLMITLAYPLTLVWKMISLTNVTNQYILQGTTIGTLVNQWLTNTWNFEVRGMLKIFSLNLIQADHSFSVCGFFKLDRGLLYSMAGSVTTYLIILIQFSLNDLQVRNDEQGNSTSSFEKIA